MRVSSPILPIVSGVLMLSLINVRSPMATKVTSPSPQDTTRAPALPFAPAQAVAYVTRHRRTAVDVSDVCVQSWQSRFHIADNICHNLHVLASPENLSLTETPEPLLSSKFAKSNQHQQQLSFLTHTHSLLTTPQT